MDYIQMTEQDIALQKILLKEYRAILHQLPEGKLSYKYIGNQIYYYKVDKDGTQHYIQKKNRSLVYDLKYRRFLEESIQRMEKNLSAQNRLLNHYTSYDPVSIENSLPKAYKDISLSHNNSSAIDNQTPSPNTYYTENLIYQTSFGLFLRSKSEVIIAELLHAAEIPFKYEPELRIPSRDGPWITYHPDFAFSPPLSDKIYWEHVGLLDKRSYRDHFFQKISDYHYNNITMPENLIITMDGPGGSLHVPSINRVIKGQLAPLFHTS